MEQEFRYDPRLVTELETWAPTLRRYGTGFAMAWWIAGLGFAFLYDPPTWAALPIAAFIQVAVIVWGRAVSKLSRRFRELSNHRLRLSGNRLIQVDSSGRELGSIDLNLPFSVKRSVAIQGNCLFTVTQDGSAPGNPRIEFGSALLDGRRLVREVLRSPLWPRSHERPLD